MLERIKERLDSSRSTGRWVLWAMILWAMILRIYTLFLIKIMDALVKRNVIKTKVDVLIDRLAVPMMAWKLAALLRNVFGVEKAVNSASIFLRKGGASL